ncbi:YihY/virulence factor BrkB family protein [Phaeacidiphilus oryzae]|uniref:YihY/virulence factor BrkB family protein n=1 Tax=Phaeacidiphilus oryzae TaxID=348818 RepID=UPI00068931F9|nr:YihY/virulence factor BrkB family protein [Phaeacidiphilus oryzae]
MDWLTGLPVVGPLVARLMRTHAYRAFDHFNESSANRLAGAVTFFGFLAMFPMLTLAAAVAAAFLSQDQVSTLQHQVSRQLPGIADSIDLSALVRNAGTVGVISAFALLFSGLGVVGNLRESIRAIWSLPEDTGNPILRKALDVGVLVGLGVVAAVSIAASSVGSAAAGWVTQELGLSGTGAGQGFLKAAGFVVAVLADMLLFAYLLAGLPRLADEFRSNGRRRLLVWGALLASVGFELLKLLISSYLSRVAAKSMYGAFGAPIALLLWINFVFRWFFYCVAWTATAEPGAAKARACARARETIEEIEEKDREERQPR